MNPIVDMALRVIFSLLASFVGMPGAHAQQSVTDGDDTVTNDCAPPVGALPFEFEAGGNQLRGYIDLPPSSEPSPVIVMVNGSLPTDVMAGGSIAGRRRLREE